MKTLSFDNLGTSTKKNLSFAYNTEIAKKFSGKKNKAIRNALRSEFEEANSVSGAVIDFLTKHDFFKINASVFDAKYLDFKKKNTKLFSVATK